MNQENTFLLNGKIRHITITPLVARQLDDLSADYGRNLGSIIGGSVDRLYRAMRRNMAPLGPGAEPETMPDGEPLEALCKLWKVRHQEVVKLALFDAWREWRGMSSIIAILSGLSCQMILW
jgi:hypothetical protein